MNEVMMKLGTFSFSVDSAAYQSLQRSTSYQWSGQSRFRNSIAMQYVGDGEETVTLTGVIYPHYKGGIGQLDTMRLLANSGEPLQMSTGPMKHANGEGYSLGRWVITQVQETQSTFLPGGVPKKQEFTLSLKRYGEDNWWTSDI